MGWKQFARWVVMSSFVVTAGCASEPAAGECDGGRCPADAGSVDGAAPGDGAPGDAGSTPDGNEPPIGGDAAADAREPAPPDGGEEPVDGGEEPPDGGEGPVDGGGGTASKFLSELGGTSTGRIFLSAVRDVDFDAEGNIYATGGISIAGYGTPGAATETYGGGHSDAFVASFAPDGTLRFFTYLGGPNHDRAYGIEVDDAAVTIAGRAGAGFPTTSGAYQTAFGGGGGGEYGTQDGFAARLSLDGSRWEWVSYLGGDEGELCRDLDVGASGEVWCAMINVRSAIAPVQGYPGAFDGTYNGGRDAALLRLSPDGSALTYATYVGGSADEVGAASVRVTSDGGVLYVVSTESDDAPVTPGAYQTSRGGLSDALLMRFDADGDRVFGTYFGGSGHEGGETHNLAVADDDSAVIAMFVSGTDLPGAVNAAGGAGDGFVAHLSADGTSLLGARFVAGTAADEIEGVDVHGSRIVVSGGTRSGDFPITAGADFPTRGGGADGFVHVVALDLSEVVYSTFVPGSMYDWVNAVAFGPDGEIAYVGNTQSLDLPTTPGAYETSPHASIPRAGGGLANEWDAGFVGRLVAP